jgi:hypothetical protein
MEEKMFVREKREGSEGAAAEVRGRTEMKVRTREETEQRSSTERPRSREEHPER